MSTPKEKILIAGETFSENLGDGVIAETLGYACSLARHGAEIRFLDLSGRTDFYDDTSFLSEQLRSGARTGVARVRARGSAGISQLSPEILEMLRWRFRGLRSKFLAQAEVALAWADVVVIGGGQLLMDNDLYFPLRLSSLVSLAKSKRVSVHIVACGVGRTWSRMGRRMIRRAIDSATSVCVRDAESNEILRTRFDCERAVIASDPALWCADVYARAPQDESRKVLGFGLLCASDINARRSEELPPVDNEQLVRQWLAMIAVARRRGYHVELFSNGPRPDQELAERIAEASRQTLREECVVAARPTTPRELASTVSKYSAVCAYRLHACLVATAYQVPTVGLSWDSKVQSFFSDTGRSDLCVDPEARSADEILDRLEEARSRGVNRAMLDDRKLSLLSALRCLSPQSELGSRSLSNERR